MGSFLACSPPSLHYKDGSGCGVCLMTELTDKGKSENGDVGDDS